MSTEPIKSVAVYCRVSSEAQRKRATIASQISTLTDYAQQKGYSIHRVYKDDGFSGSTIEGRSAFMCLLNDAQEGLFDGVLVVEHNRITRSENPEEVGKIQRIFMENNIRIISPAEGILDLKRPPDELVAWIKMWISKEEKKEISRKMRRGKIEGLRKGRWTAGSPPFGYRYEKETGKWDFHPEQRALYLEMVDRILIDRWSANQIAKDLFERGIKGKHGKFWSHGTVISVLRNSSYKGAIFANKYQSQYDPISGKSKCVGMRPRSEWIKIDIPPMISPEKWDQVQRQLDANKTLGPPQKRPSLLSGLLRCGECGSKLYIQRGAREIDVYYCCHNRRSARHKRSPVGRERCLLPYLPAKGLEDRIFGFIIQMLSNPNFVLDQVFSSKSQHEQLQDLTERQKTLEWKVSRHEERKKRLIGLYVDGNFDRADLDRRSAQIEEELEGTVRELEEVKTESAQIREGAARREKVERALKGLSEDRLGEFLEEGFQELDFVDKRRLLNVFFQSTEDYVVIHRHNFNDDQSGDSPAHNVAFEWRSMFDLDAMQAAAEQVKLGRSLKHALIEAEKDIYLPSRVSQPFSLP